MLEEFIGSGRVQGHYLAEVPVGDGKHIDLVCFEGLAIPGKRISYISRPGYLDVPSVQQLIVSLKKPGVRRIIQCADEAGCRRCWIIEGKRTLCPEAIGQVFAYSKLFITTYRPYPDLDVSSAIVFKQGDKDLETICSDAAITLFKV